MISASQTLDPAFDLGVFFDLSPDFLCIVSFDGYFLKVNSGVCNILGYSEAELINTLVENYMYPQDRDYTLKLRAELKKGKHLVHYENRYVCKNGDIVWLAWTTTPLMENKLIYGSAKNITHKKKLEQERNSLMQNLTVVNEELKKLTYTTTHDLRSPVSNMITVLSLLDRSEITNSDSLDLLDILDTTCAGLKESLDKNMEILSSRQESGNHIEDVDIYECIQTVQRSISSLLENANVVFNIDLSAYENISFNKFYLESIFLNLITNSVKYAKPDIAPIISIKTILSDSKKQLTFTDNGLGFDLDKVQDQIFGLNKTFHDNKDSKGIGLYLVKSKITSMGGDVTVYSEVNKGTTFTFTF